MKKRISSLLFGVMLFGMLLTLLSGCDLTGKQTPVYRGMSITRASASACVISGEKYLSGGKDNADYDGNNGNHNGHFKGDHSDRDAEIDEENPFPEIEGGADIEEEMSPSLEVVGATSAIYYATPYEDIYINIRIDNPDNFEIMSFTLNGKKYSSYMFEEGSDMENIRLKYNVGNARGIVEYTIDAIKYIDGTEIKDVKIGGDKTVLAGVRTENQVTATVADTVIKTDSLSFNVNISDEDALISVGGGILKAVLYNGTSILGIKDLSVGNNSVRFDGLKTGTLYQYAIGGYYDDLSGRGPAINVLYKDAFYTESAVLFDNISITRDGLSFGLLWHDEVENQALSSLKLYRSDVLLEELSVEDTAISGLLSNNEYKLVAEYMHGGKAESITLEFTTASYTTPTVDVASPTVTKDSVSFDITIVDTDAVGALDKIEIIDKNGLSTVAASLDTRSFSGLLSNSEYTLRITYLADLRDGRGSIPITAEAKIKTEAKREPTFTISEREITTDGIILDYTLYDGDSTLISYIAELYLGEEKIGECSADELIFSGLESYTDYIFRITYVYDLCDGEGEKTKVLRKDYKTHPYINVNEILVQNTEAIFDGTIYLQIKLDNPLGMTVKSVVVNGQTYGLTGAASTKKVIAEIVQSGQFEGGRTPLTVNAINVTIDGSDYCVVPKNQPTCEVFINGKIEILGMTLVNTDFESIDWIYPNKEYYALIKISNPTGYTIDSLIFDSREITDIKKLNDGTLYCSFVSLYSSLWSDIRLTEISYSNQYAEKTDKVSGASDSVFVVCSEKVRYISTPEELKNMNEGYHYKLAADIDLSGISWIGERFLGVFDGGGFAIKNMTYTATVKNAHASLGLFSDGAGIVENLNIENATLLVDVTADSVNLGYSAYCGAIFASSESVIINNCSVDEYSTISATSRCGDAYAGGFVGSGSSVKISSSQSLATVGASGKHNDYAGGFVGCTSVARIYGSECGGTVSANAFAGGLVGNASSGFVASDSRNSAKVSSEGYAGGFVARIKGKASITLSSNTGNIIGKYAGGLIGYAEYLAVSLKECSGAGKIEASLVAGGLVGMINDELTIDSSSSAGEIIAEQSGEGTIAGGLVGNACSFIQITNSHSAASVSGDTAGGLVGKINLTENKETKIEDSYNCGNINAKIKAGGLIGEIFTTESDEIAISVSRSYNTGSVTSADGCAGGLIGFVNDLHATIEINVNNAFNTGDITAHSAGGFIGELNGMGEYIVNISSSYNSGKIVGSAINNTFTSAGGFVGRFQTSHLTTLNVYGVLNTGEVDAGGRYGTLVGYNIDNCCTVNPTSAYSTALGGVGINASGIKKTSLDSLEFFTDTLLFDADVWDITPVTDGKLPILK